MLTIWYIQRVIKSDPEMGARLVKERLDWAKNIRPEDVNTPLGEDAQQIFELNYGKKVIELCSGDFFGEKALERSVPRNATIVTTRNCHLVILEKRDYVGKVKEALRKKRTQMSDFYGRIFKIKSSSFGESKSVYSISRSFEPKSCSFGEVILDHLRDRNTLLLLKEGTVYGLF